MIWVSLKMLEAFGLRNLFVLFCPVAVAIMFFKHMKDDKGEWNAGGLTPIRSRKVPLRG
jgi:hypothetical protein